MSREEWLQAALDLLDARGVEAVRVERLAATIGINKSGFYWHFRDRDELLEALLQYWKDLEELPLVVERGASPASAEDQLRLIASVVDEKDLARYDVAIRQWAKNDPKVGKEYQNVMKRRLGHIRGKFAELGFDGAELEMRARTFVCYVSSERDTFDDMSAKQRAELRDARLKMLIDPG